MAKFLIEVEEGENICDESCPFYFDECCGLSHTNFDFDCYKYDMSTLKITKLE